MIKYCILYYHVVSTDDVRWENYTYLKITDQEFTEIYEFAKNEVDMLNRLESSLSSNNIKMHDGTRAYSQYLEYMPTLDSRNDSYDSEVLLKMTQYIKTRHCSRYVPIH